MRWGVFTQDHGGGGRSLLADFALEEDAKDWAEDWQKDSLDDITVEELPE